MSTVTAPIQQLEAGKTVLVEVAMYASDGITLDTTSALVLQPSNASILQVTLDPTNNRRFTVKALVVPGPGSVTVLVTRSGIANNLLIPFQITAPPDHSKIELVSVTPVV